MLKIAGGMILGFFGIITLCVCLHDCSSSNQSNIDYENSDNTKKITNEKFIKLCSDAVIDKYKNKTDVVFKMNMIIKGHTATVISLIAGSITTNQMIGSVTCKIRSMNSNLFDTEIISEMYL